MSSSAAARKSVFCNGREGLDVQDPSATAASLRKARKALPGWGAPQGPVCGFQAPSPPAPATHLLGVKQPMAVQPQPPLLPAELAKLPLKVLGKARRQQGCSQGPDGPSSSLPTLEPVQPSRAKGNWLMGATTRSTRTALQVAPGGLGRRKMQKLRSKVSMV